jgi:hypothetical protein
MDTRLKDDTLVRELLPLPVPPGAALNLKYRRVTDVLTVLTGAQNRWSVKLIRSRNARIYLDGQDQPVRIEFLNATRLFPREWLEQHDRGGRTWRKRLGLP